MAFNVPTDFSQTASNYEICPADNHVGVCIGVIDLGTHQESYQGGPAKPVRKVKLQFELTSAQRDDGKNHIVSVKSNYSMNEKATFRKLLNNWLGMDWPERFKGRSWDFLIGLPAMVNVEHKPKPDGNGAYAYVASINKLPKGMPAPQHERDTFWLDLDDKHLPAVLSVWDAELIRASREYRAGDFVDEAPTPDGKPTPTPAQAARAPLREVSYAPAGSETGDDQIPF